jgi:hypothetical protein
MVTSIRQDARSLKQSCQDLCDHLDSEGDPQLKQAFKLQLEGLFANISSLHDNIEKKWLWSFVNPSFRERVAMRSAEMGAIWREYLVSRNITLLFKRVFIVSIRFRGNQSRISSCKASSCKARKLPNLLVDA